MAEQKDSELKKRLKEKIEGLTKKYSNPPRPLEVHGFKSELQEFVRSQSHAITTEAIRKLTVGRTISVDQIKGAVDECLATRIDRWGSKDGGGQTVFKSYGQMKKCVDDALDIRAQEKWADTQDRRQALLYRILTAVGIGAVIYLVSLLAYCTKVPLPMLRVV